MVYFPVQPVRVPLLGLGNRLSRTSIKITSASAELKWKSWLRNSLEGVLSVLKVMEKGVVIQRLGKLSHDVSAEHSPEVVLVCIKHPCPHRDLVWVHPCKTSLPSEVNGVPLLGMGRSHCPSCFMCRKNSCRVEEWGGEMRAVVTRYDWCHAADGSTHSKDPQPQSSRTHPAAGHCEEQQPHVFVTSITDTAEANQGRMYMDHLI